MQILYIHGHLKLRNMKLHMLITHSLSLGCLYGDENARRREPALSMISGFPLLHSVCHGIPMKCFLKNITRSRAALNKMSAKEERIQAASSGVLEEAVDFMKKAHELMNQQALDLRQEKEAFESVAKKLDHVHFASTIKLNVGGQYFTTSLQTLTKDKGSMLHAMFSGRFDTKPAEDGSYFIDRDGTHFRYILNYLRTGYLLVPDDKLIRKEILEEAEFYQIRGIVNQLHPRPFLGSKILSDEQKRFILNSCLKLELRHSSFVLIYRASRDGWESVDFHAHCDNKGPTVTVVKSGNYIFGGYTEQSWNGKHSVIIKKYIS